jgi:hypothetical protein
LVKNPGAWDELVLIYIVATITTVPQIIAPYPRDLDKALARGMNDSEIL